MQLWVVSGAAGSTAACLGTYSPVILSRGRCSGLFRGVKGREDLTRPSLRAADWSGELMAQVCLKSGSQTTKNTQRTHTSVASILANRALYRGGQRGASAIRWLAILGQDAA
jgi:hypothetical protein